MIALTMPMMILNLSLLFVLRLAPVEFLLWHRENLFHRFAEFVRWLLGLVNGGRHIRTVCHLSSQCNPPLTQIMLRAFEHHLTIWSATHIGDNHQPRQSLNPQEIVCPNQLNENPIQAAPLAAPK